MAEYLSAVLPDALLSIGWQLWPFLAIPNQLFSLKYVNLFRKLITVLLQDFQCMDFWNVL